MNQPIISSSKVRAVIKKVGVPYVDATRALHGFKYARGINVWQLCDSIYLRPYGTDEERAEYIAKLDAALREFGLTVSKYDGTYTMKIKVAA
jgi:hypothetical protein